MLDKTRGIKNALCGIGAQLLSLGLGFVIPRLVILNLGSEANGLLSTVASALSYMTLLEVGVGTATIQALYRPIATGDKPSINRIMSATHHFYRRTGFVYFILVILLSTLLAAYLHTSIPRHQVFLVAFMAGMSGALNYFFQGKFRLLLEAEGKNYVITSISTITYTCINITKVAVLLCGGKVVVVQAVYFGFGLMQLIIYMMYMHRYYSWIDYKAEPDFDAISQKNAVLVHQVAALIFSNTDVLVLTLLASLKSVSVYTMYAMLYDIVQTLVITLSGSFVYALGQTFHERERFMRLLDMYETYVLAISTALLCICHCFCLPFLRIYTIGVTDVEYINDILPWLFSTFYLLNLGRRSSAQVINIAQRFEDTKWRAILESCINLTVSVALTYKLGIYGVLLGTIAALLYRANDMIIYAAHVLKRSPLITYRRWVVNVVLFIAISLTFSHYNIIVLGYVDFILKASVFGFIVVVAFLATNSFIERESAKYLIRYMRSLIHG